MNFKLGIQLSIVSILMVVDTKVVDFYSLPIEATYTVYKSGPRTNPRGTPSGTSTVGDVAVAERPVR